ncbi:aminotransferase class I/II-fold pyridoxal phosphate-dependent enzyme [Nanoarchaeota archaeon]
MKIEKSSRISNLGKYAFAEVDKQVDALKKQGITPIDFGVGDPQLPTPDIIRTACKKALDNRKSSGYPNYIGAEDYRQKIAEWCDNRFRISLDSDKEIIASLGSKESVFNFPLGFVNPGDYVLVPNPGYPPYQRGTEFAGGKVHFMNLTEENNFFPKFDEIPADIAKKAKIMWLNYPNNPTTALANKAQYKEAIDFSHDNNIIIASDEPYTENYYDEDKKPISILEVDREGIVVFQSLSKRSNMTCYRIGWTMGDENIIEPFKKVKTNIDSGAPSFIQDAGIAALNDEKHVEEFRKDYKQKRDIMIKAMTDAGCPDCTPDATIYIWQKAPNDMGCVDFAKKLLDPKVGVVTTPGAWISDKANGINPGENYIRFALVPELEQVKEAAEKISNIQF